MPILSDPILPTSQPSVFITVDQLSALDQKAIIRPDNPPPGIAGFLFDLVLEDGINLTSEITDHYVEDNTAIQDQIALKPEQVTVRGMVGELVDTRTPPDPDQPPEDPLPLNDELTPALTVTQYQEIEIQQTTVNGVTTTVTNSKSLYNYYGSKDGVSPTTTKQQRAFLYFYNLWKGRQLFTVETPWGYLTNMAILSLSAAQGETTKYTSDFSVTFKRMRFAQEVTTTPGKLAGRAGQQNADTSQNGNTGKSELSTEKKQSLLRQLFPNFSFGS